MHSAIAPMLTGGPKKKTADLAQKRCKPCLRGSVRTAGDEPVGRCLSPLPGPGNPFDHAAHR